MTDALATTPPHLLRRSRWRRWALAALIFLGGAVAGGSVTAAAIFQRLHHVVTHPEEAPQRITARLSRRLDLTDEQATQVRQMIARRQQSLLQIRRDVQPRVEAQLSELEADIATVLTPEQQEKWRSMAATFRRNWLPPPPPATVQRMP